MLYISRKKGKTISLFLVVFVVAVFLISCFGVLNASESLSGDIRTSLGAAFYIRANTEVSMTENGEAEVKKNSVRITQREIDEIMQTGEIKYYNPINYGFAKSDKIQFIPGDKHTEDNNMGKVMALRFSALAPDFTDETAVLIEGKHITETDNGKILISEQLANANQLSVGDSLTLPHAKLGETDGTYIDEISVKTAYTQVEASGIYKWNIEDTSIKLTAGVADNEIYASLDVLDGLHESEAGILLAAGVSKGQIMAGFLLEVLSVAIIALILSYITFLFVAVFLGHSLFGELQFNLLNGEAMAAGMKNSLPIENYLKLSAIETLLIYLCQLVVITASTFVSSIRLTRLEPKEILSKYE